MSIPGKGPPSGRPPLPRSPPLSFPRLLTGGEVSWREFVPAGGWKKSPSRRQNNEFSVTLTVRQAFASGVPAEANAPPGPGRCPGSDPVGKLEGFPNPVDDLADLLAVPYLDEINVRGGEIRAEGGVRAIAERDDHRVKTGEFFFQIG